MDGSKKRTGIERREVLGMFMGGAAAVAAGGVLGATRKGSPSRAGPGNGRMPTIFIAHGWPLLLDDAQWVAQLRA